MELIKDQILCRKYKLMKKIGGGFFSEVWLAEDLTLLDKFALKVVDLNKLGDKKIEKTILETRIGYYSDHSNLLKIHGINFIETEGNKYAILVMEYLKEGSIVDYVDDREIARIDFAVKIIIDALKGLECLHSIPIIHNDIKPANILLGDSKEGKLSDFGLSAYCPEQTLDIKGELRYIKHLAPETIKSEEISIYTDIYQMGVTLFRLINGINSLETKCRAADFENLVVKGKFIERSDYRLFVPKRIKKIINKAINPDITKRYQSALDMRRNLEKIQIVGHWKIDENGNYQGEDDRYEYVIKKINQGKNKFDIEVMKSRKGSDRLTFVRKYCNKNLSGGDANTIITEFTTKIVEGKRI